MTNTIYELDEKSAKNLIKNSIKIDDFATPVVDYGGIVHCVFCSSEIKSHNIDGAWITGCDCDKAKDFAKTRATLLEYYNEARKNLEALDFEIQEKALDIFKKIYEEDAAMQKVTLENNNLLIMNIDNLKENEE